MNKFFSLWGEAQLCLRYLLIEKKVRKVVVVVATKFGVKHKGKDIYNLPSIIYK